MRSRRPDEHGVPQAEDDLSLPAAAHYGDGLNLYAFTGNPVQARDPLGLSLEDDAMGLIGEIQGQRIAGAAAAAAIVGRFFNTAQALGQFAFSFMPGADAALLAAALAQGRSVSMMDILAAGAGLAGPFGKAAGALVGQMFKMGGRFSNRFIRSGDGMMRFVGHACNCFVAGTLVDTPVGPVPIEEIQVGDEVLTRPEAAPEAAVRVCRVTATFRDVASAILWITLSSGATLGATLEHPIWTVERGWAAAWELQIGDRLLPGDNAGDLGANTAWTEVVWLELDPTPRTIYNLEVDGTFTYHAQGVWVHNKSCKAIFKHHAFPKFLGGDRKNGILAGLSPQIRQQFHSDLLRNLKAAGLSAPHPGNSRQWADMLADGDNQARMLEVLIETSQQYDQRLGGPVIMPALMAQLQRQGLR